MHVEFAKDEGAGRDQRLHDIRVFFGQIAAKRFGSGGCRQTGRRNGILYGDGKAVEDTRARLPVERRGGRGRSFLIQGDKRV